MFRETGTKATWANPVVTPESQRENGGWYYNPDSGSVDRWWTDGGGGGEAAPAGGGQTGGSQVSPDQYLKQYQDLLFGENRDGTSPLYQNIKSMLTPETPYPDALNRVDMLSQYRASYGLDYLEGLLTEMKAVQQQEYAQLRVNRSAEIGKPVAQNVIAGRVGEHERAASERLDAIQRQISYVSDQVNSSYSVINMMMSLHNLDYQDAVTRYNTEFQHNLSAVELTRGIASDVVDIGFKTEDLNLKIQDSARANLQIMANAITSGNLDPSSLNSGQLAELTKLEVSSGLPIGFVSSLRMSAKDRIVTTTTSGGITSVVMADTAGNLTVKKIQTGVVGGSGSGAGGTGNLAGISAGVKSKINADVNAGMGYAEYMEKYVGTAGTTPNELATYFSKNAPEGVAQSEFDSVNKGYNVTVAKIEKDTPVNKEAVLESVLSRYKSLLELSAGKDSYDIDRKTYLEDFTRTYIKSEADGGYGGKLADAEKVFNSYVTDN